jgi:hypothetical protein
MMIGGAEPVNGRTMPQRGPHEKKPDSQESGLRYWPREADTITFQEGLLNFRATGGGGQMRNANVQRKSSMVRVNALQQPPAPHVSHAEIGGSVPTPKFAASRLANYGCEPNRTENQNSGVL